VITPRVLVVDDDAANALFLRDLLADWGYEPAVAYSADHALAVARGRAVDVLITDLRMPTTDGFALIRRFRELDPAVAVIAITAFGSEESGSRAMQAGANAYLTKPFQPDALEERLRQLLERRAQRLKNERLRRDVDQLLRDKDPQRKP
jgi:two-component system OmpR family response regulator